MDLLEATTGGGGLSLSSLLLVEWEVPELGESGQLLVLLVVQLRKNRTELMHTDNLEDISAFNMVFLKYLIYILVVMDPGGAPFQTTVFM